MDVPIPVCRVKRALLILAKWDDFTVLCTWIFHELTYDVLTNVVAGGT